MNNRDVNLMYPNSPPPVTAKQRLKIRDEEIIKARNDSSLSLSEIGDRFHISRERVRQVCMRENHKRKIQEKFPQYLENAGDDAKICCFPVSFRTYQSLHDSGIHTKKDYLNCPRTKIVRIKNIGLKSFNEAETVIAGRPSVRMAEFMNLLGQV